MRGCQGHYERGSGLILALGILALLAIMATTFVTLMRVDARLTRIYCDDVTSEMLASGVLNYALGVLRDDQDRTLYRYENRDQAVGGQTWGVPGRNTDYLAPVAERYGTGASNDVWFQTAGHAGSAYSDARSEVGLYDEVLVHSTVPQRSFGGEDRSVFAIMDRAGGFVLNPADQSGPNRYQVLVYGDQNRRDDDGDGAVDEPEERYSPVDKRHDQVGFLTHGGECFLHPGSKISGESRLGGGSYWRWAAKIGVPQESYMNLNAIGNNALKAGGAARLGNLDGRGLHAMDGDDTTSPHHVGLLSWKGYPGEYVYQGGEFHFRFNAVQYSPYQLDPYRLLAVDYWQPQYAPHVEPTRLLTAGAMSSQKAQTVAESWVAQRWGPDGLPGDGSDKWRVGWRRDGASYYKIPSPDNPRGDDHYFGESEALSHQSDDIVSGVSRVFDTVLAVDGGNISQARQDLGRFRALLSTYGVDTILRGKIWPKEGWLPWRTSGTPGDWRHIDILKRVNLNIIGAKTNDHLDGNPTKTDWALKRRREQDRLYFMLSAMLAWSGTPEPEHEACQFIASLTDMVDWDQNETYYAAPDGSGAWALGVEKFPVINEVAVLLTQATGPNYETYRLRVELYNLAENIPWIPDADEAYDISDYVLRIGPHNYRLGDLKRFTTPTVYHGSSGEVTTIGADGIYGEPQALGVTTHPTWSRFAHIGWDMSTNWPPGLTRAELEGTNFDGVEISLWKPLSTEANDGNPAGKVATSPGKVEDISVGATSRRYICVDDTRKIRLVRPYGGTTGRSGPGGNEGYFVGIYRRWDPMNARLYGSPDETDLTRREESSVLWCPGWHLGNYPTLGRPNVDYALYASARTYAQWNRTSLSPNKYERLFEMSWKVVDGDLPSVGWLGELCLKNPAQDGPFTWVHAKAQNPYLRSRGLRQARSDRFSNRFENRVKLDLFRPWANGRNLHLYDMFTVLDPSNDGIDNDGDGKSDDDDTGLQAGDRLGPEVRIYGLIDINQTSNRGFHTLMPGDRHSPSVYTALRWGPNFERLGTASCDMGPRESIGDILRKDHLNFAPGSLMGGFGGGGFGYCSSVNLTTSTGDTSSDTNYRNCGFGPYYGYDDDGDGLVDERDERDYLFTQVANFITTRDHTFTIEIVTQLTDPPYYQEFGTPTYKVKEVHAQKHLILLVDRSTTLRVGADGSCDFTGPIRILAERWGHARR